MGDFYQPLYLRSGSRFRSIVPEDYLDAPVRAASSATTRQVQLDGLSQNGTKYGKLEIIIFLNSNNWELFSLHFMYGNKYKQ